MVIALAGEERPIVSQGRRRQHPDHRRESPLAVPRQNRHGHVLRRIDRHPLFLADVVALPSSGAAQQIAQVGRLDARELGNMRSPAERRVHLLDDRPDQARAALENRHKGGQDGLLASRRIVGQPPTGDADERLPAGGHDVGEQLGVAHVLEAVRGRTIAWRRRAGDLALFQQVVRAVRRLHRE